MKQTIDWAALKARWLVWCTGCIAFLLFCTGTHLKRAFALTFYCYVTFTVCGLLGISGAWALVIGVMGIGLAWLR